MENLLKAANPNYGEMPAEQLKKLIQQREMERIDRLEADNAAARKQYDALKAQGPQDKLALQLGLAADLFNVDGKKDHATTAQKVLAMDPREKKMAALKQAMKGQDSALAQAYNKMGGNDQLALEKLRQKGTLAEIQARKEADLEVAKFKGAGSKSKGMDKLNTEFAKKASDHIDAKPNLDSNVITLESVATKLEDPDTEYGNKATNWDWFNATFNPEAHSIKETVDKLTVETLKPLLGGAFSEKENQLIRELSYNPLLSDKQNAEKLRRSIAKIKVLMAAKEEAIEYFYNNNNSIEGYKGYKGKNIDDYMSEQVDKAFGFKSKSSSKTSSSAGSNSQDDALFDSIMQGD